LFNDALEDASELLLHSLKLLLVALETGEAYVALSKWKNVYKDRITQSNKQEGPEGPGTLT